MIPIAYTFPRSGMHLTAKVLGMSPFMNYNMMKYINYFKKIVEINDDKRFYFLHACKCEMNDDLINYIRDVSIPIMIIREPKDTMLSYAHLSKIDISNVKSVDAFLKKRIPYIVNNKRYFFNSVIDQWKAHINGWLDTLDNPLVIRYENWINAFDAQAKLLSAYLNKEVLNVRPSLKDVEMSRKGIIGDYKNYFNEALIRYIDEECAVEIERINKYLL